MNPDIASIRKEYLLKRLDAQDLDPDPLQQFDVWWNDAVSAHLDEPNAMNLATVNRNGIPSSRIVLLKSKDENGFTFFTNYNSDKATEIFENPNVCLNFFWMDLQRQVKINGKAVKCSGQESDEYFSSRPRGSQIGAWASPQSSVIANRGVLEKKVNEVEIKYEGMEIPRPEHWGGFTVLPVTIEFWQGRQSRLHDRFLYTKMENNAWKIERIAP